MSCGFNILEALRRINLCIRTLVIVFFSRLCPIKTVFSFLGETSPIRFSILGFFLSWISPNWGIGSRLRLGLLSMEQLENPGLFEPGDSLPLYIDADSTRPRRAVLHYIRG